MDGNAIVMRLYANLSQVGLDPNEIDDRCDAAAREYSSRLADLVADALNDAEQQALEMGATDFAAELTAEIIGGDVRICTDSGKIDFSTPAWSMLPGLLKNAKTSQPDNYGRTHRYKRIPMGDKEPAAKNSMDASKNRQAELKAAKEEVDNQISQGGSLGTPDVSKAARSYVDAFRSTRVEKHDKQKRMITGKVRWATASDDPDAKNKWMYPARDYDTAGIIMDVNNKLQLSIQELINNIMLTYGE